jgi:hypothetical protein
MLDMRDRFVIERGRRIMELRNIADYTGADKEGIKKASD